ncbi:hypothetical protein [Flavobacterium sp.]|uniref:hypothetical protein n=1 Tax=Flavobacterium sp. TaxID=239 RepID=UPI00374FF9FA
MKHLLKKFLFLFYFYLATFLYYSCTQEKEYITGQNRINFDLKEKSLKEALDMPIFSTAYSKLTKKKFSSTTSETARTALEYQFGFTIVPDEPVRIITKPDGTVLFTILIEREVKEEKKFENLMIKVKDDETTAAIFKYTMNQKGIKTESNHYFVDEITNSEFTDLNIDQKIFINTGGEICFEYYNVICDDTSGGDPAGHTAYAYCISHNTAYVALLTTCINDGGGNNPGTNPPDGSITVTTGGVTPYEPLETLVLPCHTANCIDSTLKPCDLINQVNTKFPMLKTSLLALKGTTSQTHENGMFIDNTATSATINPIQNIPAGVGGMINLNDSPPHPYVVIAHTHDALGNGQGTYSVFSMDDLAKLAKLANNNQIDSETLFYLATADGTQYVLTFNDIDKLKDFFGNTSNTTVGVGFNSAKFKKISEITDKYYYPVKGKIQANLTSTSNENDLIAFLELLKEADLGIKMYEITPDFITYKKVSLQKTGSVISVKRENCN